MKSLIATSAIVAMMGSPALADIPSLGETMSHLLVTLFQNQIYVTLETPTMATVLMQDNIGTFSDGAEVLNNQGYNGQFGWLANGFISLPPSSGIFVRTVSSSPHLSVFEQGSFDEILGTGESAETWQWGGSMTHNWYSTDVHGVHHASYEVFVGDLSGNPRDGFQSGLISLNFEYGLDLSDRIGAKGGSIHATPAPSALSLLALGSLLGVRRRR